jgi:hypothetical protein
MRIGREGRVVLLCRNRDGNRSMRRVAMQDALMLLFTAGFFAVAFLYVKACQKLR